MIYEKSMSEDASDMTCVGCGYCCIRATCTYGLHRHPGAKDGLCPELEWTGKRYICRMMAATSGMADFYREQLQAGQGCRSYLNPWRKEVRPRKREKLADSGRQP